MILILRIFVILTTIADIDPSFSVLLGSDPSDVCKSEIPKGTHSGISNLVWICVFTILGGLLIIGLAIYFIYPRYVLWKQLKKNEEYHQKVGSISKSVESKQEEMDDLKFEKRGNMEVHTAAGTFSVVL